MAGRWLRRPSGQHGIVEHRIGPKLVHPGALLLGRSQPPALGHRQAAERFFPLKARRRADWVTAANLRRRHSFFFKIAMTSSSCEPASLHPRPNPWRRTLPAIGHISGEQCKMGFRMPLRMPLAAPIAEDWRIEACERIGRRTSVFSDGSDLGWRDRVRGSRPAWLATIRA